MRSDVVWTSSRISSEMDCTPLVCGVSLASDGFHKIANPYLSECFEAPHSLVRAAPELAPSDGAVEAASKTLIDLGLKIENVDLLISSTQTPDLNNPSLASTILYKLGSKVVPGLEIKQSTAGVHYALDIASKLIQLKQRRCVLVVATEFLSRYFAGYHDSLTISDFQKVMRSRSSDAAGAFIVTSQKYLENFGDPQVKTLQIDSLFVGSDPQAWDSYAVLLPSSSQFPIRLSREDVIEGKHFPYIDQSKFISASNRVLRYMIDRKFSEFSVGQVCSAKIAIHAPIEAIKYNEVINSTDRIEDLFPDKGFLGSVGVVEHLKDFISQTASKRGFLVGIGSGVQIGGAILGIR